MFGRRSESGNYALASKLYMLFQTHLVVDENSGAQFQTWRLTRTFYFFHLEKLGLLRFPKNHPRFSICCSIFLFTDRSFVFFRFFDISRSFSEILIGCSTASTKFLSNKTLLRELLPL